MTVNNEQFLLTKDRLRSDEADEVDVTTRRDNVIVNSAHCSLSATGDVHVKLLC